ncbi:MAG: alanine--tRNA ligase, partial [Aquificae bacterium]|nr:alanine--tRNA ligase [Aquificota bacterium]
RQLESIKKKSVVDKIMDLLTVVEKEGFKVAYGKVEGLSPNELRDLADVVRSKLGSSVVLLASTDREKGKVNLIVAVSKDLTGRFRAGDIIKQVAPVVGGKGGGRPDMAQGGGTEVSKLEEAFETFLKLFE